MKSASSRSPSSSSSAPARSALLQDFADVPAVDLHVRRGAVLGKRAEELDVGTVVGDDRAFANHTAQLILVGIEAPQELVGGGDARLGDLGLQHGIGEALFEQIPVDLNRGLGADDQVAVLP